MHHSALIYCNIYTNVVDGGDLRLIEGNMFIYEQYLFIFEQQ